MPFVIGCCCPIERWIVAPGRSGHKRNQHIWRFLQRIDTDTLFDGLAVRIDVDANRNLHALGIDVGIATFRQVIDLKLSGSTGTAPMTDVI